MIDYKEFIQIDSSVRFGKPCIINTRIAVYDVLSWLASGMSIQDILADYPELNETVILSCLAFAADKEHRLRVA